MSWNGAGREGVSEGMGRGVHRLVWREMDGWMDCASVCVLVQLKSSLEAVESRSRLTRTRSSANAKPTWTR